jgi:hypothetical protein
MISLAGIINYPFQEVLVSQRFLMVAAGILRKANIMISREEARRIAEIPGNIRGSAFLSDVENIRRRMGDEGVEKVKQEMGKLGFPLEYKDFTAMAWYPLGLRVLSFLVIKEHFGWGDDDFREMGDHAPKYSFIVKLMMKFFVSPEAAIRRAPEYWKKYYSVGTLQVSIPNGEERAITFSIGDFEIIPCYCRYLEGFFRRLMHYLRPNEMVQCEEQRCELKGEQCHEFRISW